MDVCRFTFGGAEHHHRAMCGRDLAQLGHEFWPAHHRHLPIGQHEVWHRLLAACEPFCAVFRFDHAIAQAVRDLCSNFADHSAIIDDKAGFLTRSAGLIDIAHGLGRADNSVSIQFARVSSFLRFGTARRRSIRFVVRISQLLSECLTAKLRTLIAVLVRPGRAFDQILNGANSRFSSYALLTRDPVS